MIKKLCVLLFILSLTACSDHGNDGIPDWYIPRDVPEYSAKHYVLGFAYGPYFKGKGVKHVERDAKSDISRQVRSHIKSRLDFMQYSKNNNGEEQFGSNLFQVVKEETNLILNDIIRVKQHVDEDQENVYVCLAIDRKKLAKKYTLEAARSLAMMNRYKEPSEKFKELLFEHRLKLKLSQKVELAKMKGHLYGGDEFDPITIATPKIERTPYQLSFTKTTPVATRQKLTAMITEVLHDYGITINKTAKRKLLCDFHIEEEKGRAYPTAKAELTLFETVADKERMAYYFLLREAHPSGYKQAKDLVIRTRLKIAFRKKLEINFDKRADEMIASSTK